MAHCVFSASTLRGDAGHRQHEHDDAAKHQRIERIGAELLPRRLFGIYKVQESPSELLPQIIGRDDVARLVQAGKLDEAERLLRANPQWIHDDEAGWGDGILAGPANEGRHDVIAMLLRLGARVPPVSKWAPYYYFKHEATAAFLLEHGMDPNHMNWHRFTLLHHMAAEGELAKAKLLLAHGADIEVIDDEYRSTPLGVAARRGQNAMVRLLLERGADPVAAGASLAIPLTWAERKGHNDVAELLRKAGAERGFGDIGSFDL